MLAKSTVSPETTALVEDFKRYYDGYPSHDKIDWQTFIPQFYRWHPTMSAEKQATFNNIFKNIIPDADEDQRRNLFGNLAEMEMVTKFANFVEQHNNGDIADTFGTAVAIMDNFRQRLGVKEIRYIDTPIGDLLQEEFDDTGISWRLAALNNSMRKLRPGDFGIIAGRPDKGKTSFISSEVTNMAHQLPASRNVLWLNNEGPGKRIIPRLYQSALDYSMAELKEKHTAGVLEAEYRAAIGGRLDKIRIIDIHGLNNGQVEMIIEDNEPGIIIYDMIDNIRGFGDSARTDLQLEEMYKWARERSVKYDCIGLATSQISNDGDGLHYPTLGMLKDSKTGKQGACDFQLMIGSVNEPGNENSRWLSLPKNKLRRPDGPGDPKAEVVFDGTRARYRDIKNLVA